MSQISSIRSRPAACSWDKHGMVGMLLLTLVLGIGFTARDAQAQYIRLDAAQGGTTPTSTSGMMFEVTATNPVEIHRIAFTGFSTGARDIEVWYRLGGLGATPTATPPTTGWVFVGSANVNITATGVPHEVPVDIDLMLQ